MTDSRKQTRQAGLLILVGMLAGIFSVAPAVDSPEYVTEAAKHSDAVTLAAVFQLAMSLAYIGVAVLLYPVIKRFGSGLSVGFLGFRIVAATLSIVGTVLLIAILVLSQEYSQNPLPDPSALHALGDVLKASRDTVNHAFMVLVLCTGNVLLYALLFQSKLLPRWLSVWGMIGAFLSAGASVLFLFGKLNILTAEYLALNAPTVVHELLLGIWLTVKGFDKRALSGAEAAKNQM